MKADSLSGFYGFFFSLPDWAGFGRKTWEFRHIFLGQDFGFPPEIDKKMTGKMLYSPCQTHMPPVAAAQKADCLEMLSEEETGRSAMSWQFIPILS